MNCSKLSLLLDDCSKLEEELTYLIRSGHTKDGLKKQKETLEFFDKHIDQVKDELKYKVEKRRQLAKKFHYSEIGAFHGGMAVAETVYGQYVFIDEDGDRLSGEHTFDHLGPYSEETGCALTKSPGQYCFVNCFGEKIEFMEKFIEAGDFHDEMAKVRVWGGPFGADYWSFINDDFVILNERFSCSEEPGDFSEGLTYIYLPRIPSLPGDQGQFIFKNKDGVIAFDTEGMKLQNANSFSEGLASVLPIGERWCFIDHDGKKILEGDWNWAGSFGNGLAPVKEGDDYYYINKKGEVVLSIDCLEANDFHDGLAPIRDESGYYMIDTKGRRRLGPFDDIDNFFKGPFKEGMLRAKKGGKYFYIDRSGEELFD